MVKKIVEFKKNSGSKKNGNFKSVDPSQTNERPRRKADVECFLVHWKRNYPKYLAEKNKLKHLAQVY
jgi:hypothetical protein